MVVLSLDPALDVGRLTTMTFERPAPPITYWTNSLPESALAATSQASHKLALPSI